MDLFGRRVKCIELPTGSAALSAGIYAGTYAAAGGFEDVGIDSGNAADRRPEGADVGSVAQNAVDPNAADSGAASTSDSSWSGSDGAGGGNWWNDAGASGGDWSVDFSV